MLNSFKGFSDLEDRIFNYIELKEDKNLNIIYIGANDGVYLNPLYNVLRSKADNINILVSEPQEELITILTYHLNFLKQKIITQSLINDGREKLFYSIKPESYKYFKYYWFKNQLPIYSTPTIIASCNRTFFEQKYYDKAFNPKQLDLKEHVNITKKQSMNLASWVSENKFPTSIHILIIMAQGEDSTILYNNNWAIIEPDIIICDNTNWPQENINSLQSFLDSKKYVCDTIYTYAQFMIAIRK